MRPFVRLSRTTSGTIRNGPTKHLSFVHRSCHLRSQEPRTPTAIRSPIHRGYSPSLKLQTTASIHFHHSHSKRSQFIYHLNAKNGRNNTFVVIQSRALHNRAVSSHNYQQNKNLHFVSRRGALPQRSLFSYNSRPLQHTITTLNLQELLPSPSRHHHNLPLSPSKKKLSLCASSSLELSSASLPLASSHLHHSSFLPRSYTSTTLGSNYKHELTLTNFPTKQNHHLDLDSEHLTGTQRRCSSSSSSPYLAMLLAALGLFRHEDRQDDREPMMILEGEKKWDVIDWFQDYYQHPDPDGFVAGIQQLLPSDLMLFLIQVNEPSNAELVSDTASVEAIERSLYCMRVVGFMSEIFHAHPDRIWEWYRQLQSTRGKPPFPYEEQGDKAKLLFSQFLWFALDNSHTEEADDILDQIINHMIPGGSAVDKATARANMRAWLDIQLNEPANRMAIARGKYYASGRVELVETALKNARDYLRDVAELGSEKLMEVAAKHVLRDLTGFAADKNAADYMKGNLHFANQDPALRKLMIKAMYQGGNLF